MSYQDIDVGTTERFFTVIDRQDGLPITSGIVNYHLKAKSGPNAGKWWRDSDQTWQDAEVGNPMTHEADGHWEIDLSSSPFAGGLRFIEYVKELNALHVPHARHLFAKNALTIDALGQISSNNMRGTDGANTVAPDNATIQAILNAVSELQDSDELVDAVVATLNNLEVRPERVILGPCARS